MTISYPEGGVVRAAIRRGLLTAWSEYADRLVRREAAARSYYDFSQLGPDEVYYPNGRRR